MVDVPSREELEAAHCWEANDQVPRQPEMTAFRRRVRLQQARWRESHGHPIGSQPIIARPGKPFRRVGSRIPLDYARETGANLISASSRDAADARLATKEREQSFDQQGLWADLLSSPALAFNLFGDLAADHALADRAVHTWWPDVPGTVCGVRFAHSPGRLDTSYAGNLIVFDAAFVLDLGDGTKGVIAVDVKYHDRIKRLEPKPARLSRYVEVMNRSGAFTPHALDAANGTDLLLVWLGHLLMYSMLQHPTGVWRWGRYVVVHSAGNTDWANGCARYGSLLADTSTFAATTVEEFVGADALPRTTISALRERYFTGASI